MVSGRGIRFVALISVHSFFVSRIWYLTRNVYLAVPIALLALLNICAGIAQTTLAGIGGTFSQLIHTEVVTSIQAGATAACDLTITVTLCWILNGKRTGIKATDTLLDTLIILAINRGAITSLAALFNLVLFVWRPSALFFMIPLLPSCQFYVLSVVGRNQTSQDVLSLPMDSMNNPEHEHNEGRTILVTTSVMTWTDEENTDRKRDV
ncbi:hypothetical protein BDZ89DRAFT_159227 [Hymenopellis radicata]|nr:hypothetical protein BDZ89DRAFT_159227 [Hymenopellis radicata]